MKLSVLVVSLSSVWAMCTGKQFRPREFSLVALPFRYHGIVPEFVDEAPTELLEVSFPGFQVYLGNRATASQVPYQPELHWNCDHDALYTLIMFDCDPLGQGTRLLSEVSQWVVGNIKHCDIHDGQVLTDWHGPSPPIDTGLHRIVFLMFKQKGKINFKEPFIGSNEVEGRLYTTAKKFVLKYSLGRPVAGNFHLCEYDWRTDVSFAAFGTLPEYVQNAFVDAGLGQRERQQHVQELGEREIIENKLD